MTSSFRLFGQMIRQKSRFIYYVLVVQLLTLIIIAVVQAFTKNSITFLVPYDPKDFWEDQFENFNLLTVFFDLIFAGLMCWQSEKIDDSQTWRLAPVSGSRLYLVNLLSSLGACAIIFIVQELIILIIGFPAGQNPLSGRIRLTPFVFIVLTALLLFVFVSFVNFSSKTIANLATPKNEKWISIFLIAILVIIGTYLAFNANDQIQAAVARHYLQRHNYQAYDSMSVVNIEFAVSSVILLIANLALLAKFVEARQDR